MTGRMFTAEQMHVYACIIEQLVDPIQGPRWDAPWQNWRDQNGINELREAAMELIDPCDADWERAYANYENPPEGTTVADPGSFDYDFVPFWLSNKVDWSDPTAAPRIRGTTVSNDVRQPDAIPNGAEPVLACPSCLDTKHLYDRADVRYDTDLRDWVVGDREGTIECTECDWSGAEQDLVRR